MRRLLSIAVLCLAGLAGCHHMAGVCDCDLDDDPCLHRAPWAHCHNGTCSAVVVAPVAAPLPAVKNMPQLGAPTVEKAPTPKSDE